MASKKTAQELTHEFLKVADHFKLGTLPTESRHHKTLNLSSLAKNELNEAVQVVADIDLEVFKMLREKAAEIRELGKRIREIYVGKHNVYLSGCGATGRLALALETIWRRNNPKNPEFVRAFMAGGDFALIKSIENFEDFPEYGERQLEELGFKKEDLLIAITEGGETPFVIGTANYAVSKGSYPYFVYCNPDHVLKEVAERSKEVIENPHITKLNLTVGPMVISGSTRMQASTIQMAAVGFALELMDSPISEYERRMDDLIRFWAQLPKERLAPFIRKESKLYSDGDRIVYRSCEEFAISVLTDTTERSPTFSLPPFENTQDKIKTHCLCYLSLSNEKSPRRAWERMLLRRPRTLEWKEISGIASYKKLMGFDIGEASLIRRKLELGGVYLFDIDAETDQITFSLDGDYWAIPTNELPFLEQHLIIKILLNTHSTLVMGRLGRYEENIMTWVKPSNNKLIDRSIRYCDHLLRAKGIVKSYEELALRIFELRDTLTGDEPIVVKVVNSFSAINE